MDEKSFRGHIKFERHHKKTFPVVLCLVEHKNVFFFILFKCSFTFHPGDCYRQTIRIKTLYRDRNMQKTFAVSRSLHCVCVYEFLMIYKLTDKNFMFHNLIIFYHNSSNQKKTLSKNKTIQSSSIKPK